ncbi:Ribosomal RNA large subunit methyltransferase J, partial [Pseudomonas amygdali pv. eriobotryae]
MIEIGRHKGAGVSRKFPSNERDESRKFVTNSCSLLRFAKLRSLPGAAMNYRHAYHAGNHADVFKHLTLTRLIALMARKEQPFAYLDTHAGLGLYDLKGDQATRTGEWLEGIGRLWDAPDLPALASDYLQVLHDMNPDGELRYYPGSPE